MKPLKHRFRHDPHRLGVSTGQDQGTDPVVLGERLPGLQPVLDALGRADQILWLITGQDKKAPLAKLLAGDTSIPAGRVEAGASLVMCDQAAAPTS